MIVGKKLSEREKERETYRIERRRERRYRKRMNVYEKDSQRKRKVD